MLRWSRQIWCDFWKGVFSGWSWAFGSLTRFRLSNRLDLIGLLDEVLTYAPLVNADYKVIGTSDNVVFGYCGVGRGYAGRLRPFRHVGRFMLWNESEPCLVDYVPLRYVGRFVLCNRLGPCLADYVPLKHVWAMLAILCCILGWIHWWSKINIWILYFIVGKFGDLAQQKTVSCC